MKTELNRYGYFSSLIENTAILTKIKKINNKNNNFRSLYHYRDDISKRFFNKLDLNRLTDQVERFV